MRKRKLWSVVLGMVLASQAQGCGCSNTEKKRAKGTMTSDGGRPSKDGKPAGMAGRAGAPAEGGAPALPDGTAGEGATESSPDGGEPSADGAPVIVTQPSDVTLVEYQVGTFEVEASGDDLTYQWECHLPQQMFAEWPYATSPTLILDSPPISQNGLVCRVIIENEHGRVTSREARLTVLPAEQATGVRIVDSNGVRSEDAVMVSVTSDAHQGFANLGSGQLGSAVYAPSFYLDTSAAFDVRFVNEASNPITIGAGQLRAHIAGTYEAFTGQTSSQQLSTARLAAYPELSPSESHSVGFEHEINVFYVNNAPTMQTHDLTPSGYTEGVDVSVDTLTALELELSLPALELAPGEGFRLMFELTTGAYSGLTNFAANPATVSLVLPAGVTLDSTASVPLSWVTNE